MKSILVRTAQEEYPVIIGENIYKELPKYLMNVGIGVSRKILIISDQNVASFYLNSVINVLNNYEVSYYIIPPGESSKNINLAENIIEFAIKEGLDRTSVILALGGGVVGDLAGFVASIYMRGIAFVQLPTTVLAHDSSVGGKVGINHRLGKNLIGAFLQPKLVLYDITFLQSLPKREIQAGLAEIIKHGLIADSDFSYWLRDNASSLLQLKLEEIEDALFRAITIKANIVKEDEKELGIRALLNYGHTFAHALEIASNFNYLHGEAVAIGMVFASKLAYKLNLTSDEVVSFTTEIIKEYQLPTTISPEFNSQELLNVMKKDKKFINGNVRMVLPEEVGRVVMKDVLSIEEIKATMEEIKLNGDDKR